VALDWDWADAFLKGGRKKYERPLYDRGLRIWKTNKWDVDSDISIGWKYSGSVSTFVTYHKNGTTTIQGNQQPTHWGGSWTPLRSQSVRLTIHRYAGIKVFQRNYKIYLEEDDAPITPPKIQGCRMCKQSGLLDSWCYPTTCWDGRTTDTGKCPTHPDVVLRLGSSWHYSPCEHGYDHGHEVPKGQKCYSCGGTKKRDYGSKPERTQWSGSPLRLREGKIIKSAATLLERMVADYVEPIG
jgi:hypothetical protein